MKSIHRYIGTSVNLLILTVLLLSCQPPTMKQTGELFDVHNYFEQQVSELKHSSLKVHKTVTANGHTESKDVQVDDWNTELKPFLEVEISKPAVRNSYRVDTVGSPPMHIIYTAIDSSQAVRRVEMEIADNRIKQVSILKNTGNSIIRSTQSLLWNAGAGYSISGKQYVALGQGNEYTIKVEFK